MKTSNGVDLKEKYKKEVVPEFQKTFGYKNVLAVPSIRKVIINVGLNRKETEHNAKYIDIVKDTISQISGQKPVERQARKSIAGFKIREGLPVGICVTLRRKKMYDFMERLIHITMPRIRDFRGLREKSVDEGGGLSIGFKEHTVFPEIDLEKVDKVHGLQVIISSNAPNKEQALHLFKLLGFPFEQKNK